MNSKSTPEKKMKKKKRKRKEKKKGREGKKPSIRKDFLKFCVLLGHKEKQ